MRGAIAAVFLAVCVTPAYAQEQESIHAAAARVMIEALAPSSYGDWAYGWGPVSARVSRHVHWHVYEPDPRDRAPDAIVRRNGWIDTRPNSIDVSIYGGDERVSELSFRFNGEQTPNAVLAALREAGADVRAESVAERRSDYTLAPPERDAASLRHAVSCTSPRSAAAQRCWTSFTLFLPQPSPGR